MKVEQANAGADRGDEAEPGPTRRWARLSALVGPSLLVALAAAQLAPGLRDGLSPPISWDHGAHLGKAMLTAQELLPALRGWTDSVEAGVPLNTLYSVGSTAFLLLVRALTPFLDWLGSYALAVLAVRALVALAVHRVVRVAGGGRVAAFVGGAFALVDHGDHSEGGWFYDIQFGVWPVSLAIALFLFGFADLVKARTEGRVGLLPRAALLLGGALVTHQMSLLGLLVFAPVFVLTRWFDAGAERTSSLGADLRTVALTAGTAVLLASFWLVPMLAHRDEMSQHGQLYRTVAELGRGALVGEFVLRAGAFTAVVCAFGVLRGLFSSGTRRTYAVLAVLLLLISSRDWLVTTGILRAVPTLGSIMYPRFLMLAKPLYFALAGAMLGELFVLARAETARLLGERRGRVSVVLVLVLLAPFAPGLYAGMMETAVHREVAYARADALYADFLAYARWERESARTDGYYRVAYHNTESHLFQAAPAFTGRPAHKIGMLIAEVFGNTTPSGSPAALAAMNVRRVVSVGAPPESVRGRIHPVASFGRIRVDDLDTFDPRVVLDPSGQGSPRLLGTSRDRLSIAPGGARRLLVRRAYARGFEAHAEGRALRVRPYEVPGAAPLRLIEIEVPAGAERVELRYRAFGGADVLGITLSWLGLATLLLVTLPHRRVRALRERSAARAAAALQPLATPRAVRGLAALAAVVVVGLVLRATLGRGFDARAALSEARVEMIDADGRATPCEAPRLDGGPGVQCPVADWTYVGNVVQTVQGRLRECVWAHPLGGAQRLVITFPEADLGGSLRIGAGIADEALGQDGPDVELAVRVDARELATLAVPWRSRWVERTVEVAQGEHRLAIEVRGAATARRFLCFEATSPHSPR